MMGGKPDSGEHLPRGRRTVRHWDGSEDKVRARDVYATGVGCRRWRESRFHGKGLSWSVSTCKIAIASLHRGVSSELQE
jgi:hypothetical protein